MWGEKITQLNILAPAFLSRHVVNETTVACILLHLHCQKSGQLIGVNQWSLLQAGNTCHVVFVKV